MRKILFVMSIEIMVFGCIWTLCGISNYEYQKAISRCGNETNLITKYTSQGDKYYTCKK